MVQYTIAGLSVGDPLTTVAAVLGEPDDVQVKKGLGCMWYFQLEVDVWFLNDTGRVTVVESRGPTLDRDGSPFLRIGDTEEHIRALLGPPDHVEAAVLDYQAQNLSVYLKDSTVTSLTIGIDPDGHRVRPLPALPS